MTTILSITLADLRRLAGIDAADTSQDAGLGAVQASEQAVIEYGLDPACLTAAATDGGLSATLALGVAEILAGRFLAQQARAPGALDDFKIGPLTLTASKTPGPVALAQALAAHGAARLAPYAKAAVASSYPTAPDLLPAPPLSVGLAGGGASGLFSGGGDPDDSGWGARP